MRRKILSWIGLLLVAVFMLPGPGYTQKAPVTLRVVFPGTSETEKQDSLRLKAIAERTFPDVKIEFMYIGWPDLEKKLSVMLPGGDIPDLLQQQEATTLVVLEALEPLDTYLTRPGSPKKEQFYAGVWNYSIYNGKQYTIPIRAVSYGLLVREDLLNAAGMQLADLKTWDGLKKAAKAMTTGNVYGYTYALGQPRFAWREGPYIAGYSNGVDLSDTSDAAKAKYIEVLRLFKDLQPTISPSAKVMGLREAMQAWALGNAAMFATGDYVVANVYPINPQYLKSTRAIAFPKGPSGQRPTGLVSNVGWAMFRGGKHKDEAWKVLSLWTNLENLQEESALLNTPARRDIDMVKLGVTAAQFYPEAADANRRIINDFVKNVHPVAVPIRKILHREEMEVVFQKYMIELFDGRLTPEQTYEKIKPEIERIKRE